MNKFNRVEGMMEFLGSTEPIAKEIVEILSRDGSGLRKKQLIRSLIPDLQMEVDYDIITLHKNNRSLRVESYGNWWFWDP